MQAKGTTVFVGLSGGVDSSVAALRLKQQGYTVVGVFIKVWHPDFLECNWEAERLDAMRVAAKLDILFLMCDAQEEYKRDVADYFIAQYTQGKTPNPDVMCNKYVKFGAFLKFAEAHKADYIATGHYAQNISGANGFELHRGIDGNKDQSYFLWTLTQDQLSRVLLPVGNTQKVDIRREAQQAGLLTATKRDSQGICFLGHVDIADFLSHYTTLTTGPVMDEAGSIIGEHRGALVYTTGQRHGFTVFKKDPESKPVYVKSRNLATNTLVVSESQPHTAPRTQLHLEACNFINSQPLKGSIITVQTRYRQTPVSCEVEAVDNDSITLRYQEQSDLPASGQSCVLYEGTRCVGGGIIS